MNSAILVLSGPSGAGKSTIIQQAANEIGDFYFSVSTTTREPRDGEKEGVDYYFVSQEDFKKGIENGDFLEYAKVHDNYYGTSIKPVKKALKENKLVIFDIDVQGHRLIRKALKRAVVSVFITPPSLKELERRLKSRSSDNIDIIKKRLENAKKEIRAIDEYDFIIVNDNLQKATDEFIHLAKTARLKWPIDRLNNFLKEWLKE